MTAQTRNARHRQESNQSHRRVSTPIGGPRPGKHPPSSVRLFQHDKGAMDSSWIRHQRPDSCLELFFRHGPLSPSGRQNGGATMSSTVAFCSHENFGYRSCRLGLAQTLVFFTLFCLPIVCGALHIHTFVFSRTECKKFEDLASHVAKLMAKEPRFWVDELTISSPKQPPVHQREGS